MVFEQDGTPVDPRGRTPYAERFIHGALYEMRADVHAVIHNHSLDVIPFGVTGVPLRPIVHVAAPIGERPPVWDIRDKFSGGDMLVVTMEQGRDLARAVGAGPVALMRGHGCVVAGGTIRTAVMTAVYLQVNARLQMDALRLGEPRYLAPEEIEYMTRRQQSPLSIDRVWEYWRQRASAADL